MVKEVINDMVPFANFTFMALVMIGTTMYHLGNNTVQNEDKSYELEEKEPIYTSILKIYLIMFGEYDLDAFGTAEMSLFIVSTILLSVVMLNLVIAIISNSFDRVIDEKEESDGLELN
jgi:hypothetical protein